MKIEHCWTDGPEYIKVTNIDEKVINSAEKEFFSFESILKLPEDTGTARDENNNIRKSNHGIFVEEVYTPESIIVSPSYILFKQIIEQIKTLDFTTLSYLNYIHTVENASFLLSGYRHNDYYLPHRDKAVLTGLFWLSEKTYEGGELVFTDFDYTVTPEKNTGIIFPSHYFHKVNKIKTNQKGFVRICLSAFMLI